jgi:hypothetical protein
MRRIIAACVALLVLVLLAFPFARDAYNRHRVMTALRPVMTPQDRVAFQSWSGDAESFARSLLNRCRLENGPSAAACEPYRVAAKD